MKKLFKALAFIAVILVAALWLVVITVESDDQRIEKFSKRIFDSGFPIIETLSVHEKQREYNLLISEKHLDYPKKLRELSDSVCGIHSWSHCYIRFFPTKDCYIKEDCKIPVFFTFNNSTGVNELAYNFEDGSRSDTATNDKDSLQKYFADHNKPWQ